MPDSASKPDKHTPFSSLIPILPRTLHKIMAQDIRYLKGMVNLHAGVDADAAVLVEIASGFLSCGEEDSCIVCGMLV